MEFKFKIRIKFINKNWLKNRLLEKIGKITKSSKREKKFISKTQLYSLWKQNSFADGNLK